MEYSIDRSCYRRRATADSEEDKKYIYKVIKKLIIQSIAAGLVLLIIYIMKVMQMNDAMVWLEEEVNKDIPLSIAYGDVKTKIIDLYNYISLKENIETTSSEQEKSSISSSEMHNEETNINENLEPILFINTDISTEPVYEEAVEGINQMSDDAKYVKEHYNLIYPIQGQVTSKFGVRTSENPIVTPYHSGIDLAANEGTKIQAALDGEVITATTGEAYGKHIMIKKDNLVLVYAHCSKLNVKEGQKIKKGEIIGEVGSTGWATGPHLHFEVRYDGRFVNPADILDFGE